MRCIHFSYHHPCNHQLSSSIFKSEPQTEQNSDETCSFELSSSTQSAAYLVDSQIRTTNWTELLWDVFIWVVIIHAIISLVRVFSNQHHKLNRILMRCVHLSCHHPWNHQLSSSIFKSAPQTEQNSHEMCSFELSSSTQSAAYLVDSQIRTTNWTEFCWDVFIWIVIIYPIISLPRLFSNQHHKLNRIMVRCVHLSCHHLPNHQLSSFILKSAPQTEQNSPEMCSFELSSSTQSSR